MFDATVGGGNPGRIMYCGAAEDNQQHFPDEAPLINERQNRRGFIPELEKSLKILSQLFTATAVAHEHGILGALLGE